MESVPFHWHLLEGGPGPIGSPSLDQRGSHLPKRKYPTGDSEALSPKYSAMETNYSCAPQATPQMCPEAPAPTRPTLPAGHSVPPRAALASPTRVPPRASGAEITRLLASCASSSPSGQAAPRRALSPRTWRVARVQPEDLPQATVSSRDAGPSLRFHCLYLEGFRLFMPSDTAFPRVIWVEVLLK